MSRARDLAALVTPNLFNQNAIRTQVGLGTDDIGAKIQVGGAVSAVTYYGDGSNLTGIALSAASSQQISNLSVTGIATFNQVFFSAGGTVYGGDFNNTTFTGVTTFSQVSAGGSLGQDGQVLISTGSGVEWRDPVGIRTEIFITAGIGSTQFNFLHDPNDLDVFINGIKLEPTEYTSDGGTVVSLAASTRSGDIVNLVGYGVSGYVGQQGSLTVRSNGNNVGNIGGIKILDFRGNDVSVTGSGTSVSVNIPQRKGFVDSRGTRAYIAHDNVGASQTQFSFLPIASSITYDNTDIFVAGYKQYVDQVTLNFSNYVGLVSAAPTGSDVIAIGYASNGVRTGVGSTAVTDQSVFNFPATGIGTPGRIASGRPIDVYYRGVKLVENETYISTYGDAIILDTDAVIFEQDSVDVFTYTNNSKVGILTQTATEGVDIIRLAAPVSQNDPDLVINGIKQPYGNQVVGVTSVIELLDTPAPNPGQVGATVIINSYENGGKRGISTSVVGAGETILLGTLDDEHFVNGIKITGSEIDSVGITSIVSIQGVPEVGSILENIRYVSGKRVGITTITASTVGQTVFTDTNVSFAKSDVDVFYNGVKLTASEFSIVGTSNTVTLNSGADEVGDILEIIRWSTDARYGITTFTIPPAFNFSTVVSAGSSVGIGSTEIVLDVVTNVAIGDSIVIPTGAGTTFAGGVQIVSVGATSVFVGAADTISSFINAGTAVIVSRPNPSVGQTNFTVGIPTGVPDNDVYINGVKLDSGGASPEFTVVGSGNTIQLAVGVNAGDVIEVVGIVTDARITNREVSVSKVGAYYVYDINDHTGSQETYVNGVRVLGAERTTYGPNDYVYLSSGAVAGSIFETYRYASWARVGVSTFVIGAATTTVTVGIPTGVPDSDVYVNGLLQVPTTDYTVIGSGNTIGFTTSLSVSDVVEVVGIATTARVQTVLTSGLNENIFEIGHDTGDNEIFVNGIHQQQTGIVSTYPANQYVVIEDTGTGKNVTVGDELEVFEYASWARVGVTTFLATAGQTNFTVGIPTGVPDNDVYVNGVHLGASDYTVIGGGATIGLSTAPGLNALVEIVGIATTARTGLLTEYSAVVDSQATIPISVDIVGSPEIYVNGVRFSNDMFTVDSDTELRIDVLSPSESGDHVELIEYNSDFSQLGRTSASYRAFAGQTEFQVAYDDVKLLDVFVNGLLLTPSEYSAETGTNIILNNPLAVNDLVELISYTGTNVADWVKTSVGIYNTSRYVGVGTTATNYQLEVGYPGIAGTTLWVHGDARVTGILSVGQGTIAIDGDREELRIGSGIILNSQSGVITATSFVGNITGTITGDATGLSTDASVNTTGIITATGGFFGNLTGTATSATTALGFSTSVDINTTGILTATKMVAGIGSFGDAIFGDSGHVGVVTASAFIGNLTGNVTGTATGLSASASVNTSGIITASSFVGNLTGNVTGTATTATTALSLSTDVNINTTGIVTAGTFAGNLAGTASTATLALGFSTTASINTTGIITASTFSGSLIGNVQGTANIAQVALALTTNGSVNTSGIITASSFVGALTGNVTGNLTGTATTATTALGLSTTSSVNTTGIITASSFVGTLTGNVIGTADIASVGLALSTNASVDTVGIITAAAFVSDGDVTLLGDNNILGIGTGYRVGVGTLTPAADAILDLKSTTQVFLPPRMTAAQRNSIGSTSTGAIIFNTDSGRHQGYDGSAWNDFYL